MTNILEVKGLTTSFLRSGIWTPVVHGIDFQVKRGETLAVVGESGSGKSVTALSVMRLLPPRTSRVEGSIKLGGDELLDRSEAEMRGIRGNRVAMIFQEPMTSLNPLMPVGEQIKEAIMLHRNVSLAEAKALALDMLDKVRIPSAAKRYGEIPHQFSGGMRQRVMIAMALACKPELIIADEPTTALDVTIQAQILELLRDLREEEDMSVLFITHDMGVVAEIADRVMVMQNGSLVEEAEVRQLFRAPAASYTRTLLEAVPVVGSMAGKDAPEAFKAGTFKVPPSPRPAHEAPLLDVTGLTIRFEVRSGLFERVSARVHAVENVSFSIGRGETLALVGESGSGKSTIGRTLVGLASCLRGEIRVAGEKEGSLCRTIEERRQRVQMIFQDPYASLDPRLRIGRALTEPLRVRGVSERDALEQAAELMRLVRLSPDMLKRFPHEFSGGQRQRICIARALSVKPALLIADEAVSALDVSIKAQIIDLMLELQQELDLSYLFISHDMAVVERLSHRVAVMYLGEIVEMGSRRNVFENPQHPYTRRLLQAVPVPDPERRMRRSLAVDEIHSPIRTKDFIPPVRRMITVSPGHVVQQWEMA